MSVTFGLTYPPTLHREGGDRRLPSLPAARHHRVAGRRHRPRRRLVCERPDELSGRARLPPHVLSKMGASLRTGGQFTWRQAPMAYSGSSLLIRKSSLRGNHGEWDAGGSAVGPGMVELPGDRVGVPMIGYAVPHKYPAESRSVRSRGPLGKRAGSSRSSRTNTAHSAPLPCSSTETR